MPKIWFYFWAIAVAVTWIIPNHFRPWTTFHTDAWMGIALWTGGGALIFSSRINVSWNKSVTLVLLIACIPWVQWGLGILPLFGQAWMSSLYTLALALAILIGMYWESTNPSQLMQGLWSAICAGAMVSVALQLMGWLNLQSQDISDIWTMGVTGNRQYANLGQPNMLASLLVWGILAALWFYEESKIGLIGLIALVLYFLVGLALTQSRTGTVELGVLLVVIWWKRALFRNKYLPLLMLLMSVAYLLMPAVMLSIQSLINMDSGAEVLRTFSKSDSIRVEIWKMFAKAALIHPWLGYGFTEVVPAQIEIAPEIYPMGIIYAQSHNLLLDFVLWFGFPVTIVIIYRCSKNYIDFIKNIGTPQQAVIFSAVTVMLIHAMLELPLHHAYFLLPTGLMWGVLLTKLPKSNEVKVSVNYLRFMWVIVGIAMVLTIRDYLVVEKMVLAQRMEIAGYKQSTPQAPSSLFVLTQLQTWLAAGKIKTTSNMTNEELNTVESLALRYPTVSTIYIAAKSYALNSKTDKANYWIGRICKFSTHEDCYAAKIQWDREAESQLGMKNILWPQFEDGKL